MISTGDMPPICSQMYFQVQPFSRLMSRSFSVRSARFIVLLPVGWPASCSKHMACQLPRQRTPQNARVRTIVGGNARRLASVAEKSGATAAAAAMLGPNSYCGTDAVAADVDAGGLAACRPASWSRPAR